MLRRLSRMYQLSRKDPKKLDMLLTAPAEIVELVPDADDSSEPGAFFPEATVQDHLDQEAEDSGMKAWIDRIKQL